MVRKIEIFLNLLGADANWSHDTRRFTKPIYIVLQLVGAELKREKNRTPCFAGLLPLFRHNLEMNALQAKKQREKNLSYLYTEKLNPI